ncbi:MAG: AGE family epimerase/isomerase [Lachnospiraceae bacterium]|nr:AGE family epimerase/isomerase [Lachnospiraceae bacterium]
MKTLKKYELDTTENKMFLDSMREDLLSFGHRSASPGGGSYYMGDDGTPLTDRPRETWITSRMAHVYSMGELLGHKGSRDLAAAAVKGLIGELHDDEYGGWYAGIAPDGSFLPDKQCYAHAFVILAASSAKLANIDGAEALLEEAVRTYDRYFWNEEEGLSVDTWDTGFEELSDYRGLNSNMHTVEAFLAAADVLNENRYRQRAGRIIDHVILWAGENDWRIPEHYTKDWVPDLMLNRDKPDDPFKPFGATPGHGIEWARLIIQYSVSTFADNKNESGKYTDAAVRLYDRAVGDAWTADGAPGLCYTTDWEGKPVVHDRMHWTLAEAINTSAVLYRVTGLGRYAEDYSAFMKYLDEEVIDHKTGSWYHQLDQNNEIKTTVWPGKPDLYHAVQAALIPYNRETGLSVAVALGTGKA